MIRKAPSPVPFGGGLECRPEDRAAPALVIEPTTQATIFYVVFAATLIGRPFGALIFGYFGDSLGRRQTTLISVVGFSVVTLLIALLQGYEARVALALRH
jgi:MFS family permease